MDSLHSMMLKDDLYYGYSDPRRPGAKSVGVEGVRWRESSGSSYRAGRQLRGVVHDPSSSEASSKWGLKPLT